MSSTIHIGDSRHILTTLADNSVDAVVTDPPYELGFMGKAWDASGVAYDVGLWREVLRVLKPGGHLLAFGGSRTYHRLACAIEDAGFEIRDQIMWVYGSGFPKSLDVSKAIDKRGGSIAGFEGFRDDVRAAMKRNGVTRAVLQDALGNFMLSHYLTAGSQPAIPNLRDYLIIRDTVGLSELWDSVFLPEAEREVVGSKISGIANRDEGARHTIGASKAVEVDITAPATVEAKRWEGWGTALKPAHEPIVVARKPLDGTVAANVLEWGVGGLNIDGCRIGNEVLPEQKAGQAQLGTFERTNMITPERTGRWPANLIHDGSDEVLELFPDTGKSTGGRIGKKSMGNVTNVPAGQFEAGDPGYGDSGSAARFFYCAKAGKKERNHGLDHLEPKRRAGLEGADRDGELDDVSERWRTQPAQNHHPTVKPVALMRYLIRLVTPPGGLVLDPFTGSGTTGIAAKLEHANFIGIEQDAEYANIAENRINAHRTGNP